MSVLPGGIDTSQGPPTSIPLRHFVVGLAFLLAGVVAGVVAAVGDGSRLVQLAHVHLLLAGWVCVTIMGAMTQFVPVWSGTELYSPRLANAQLALFAGGIAGMAIGFSGGMFAVVTAAGTFAVAGIVVFVFNLGRTLASIDAFDVTEAHFAVALLFFLALAPLGWLLATDLTVSILDGPVTHAGVLGAHATLAVFGAILTTVYGALYQLATMFTGTDLDRIDRGLQAIESGGHPVGVVLLAAGRLFDLGLAARLGGVLVATAAVCVGIVLARRLLAMEVQRTPMHTRYAVAAVALVSWGLLAFPAWASDPLAPARRFGHAGSLYLLVLGVIGVVVLGTLYHVVPFLIWVTQYSDDLGFGDVPMIDDLYDDRIAALDGTLIVVGTALLVVDGVLGAPAPVATVGGVIVVLGAAAFAGNLLLVIRRHGPQSIDAVVLGNRLDHGEEEPTPD